MTRMKLSSRYRQALHFAAELHEDQYRKGTDIPYVSHLMSVSALVLEYGGDEDQAIAGLLHDSIEDQSAGRGGAEALAADLARQFGAEVIRIVWACTDATVVPKPPWKERKLAYLEHLRSVDARVALVVAADKLHNARSIVADYYVNGDAIFAKFNAPKSETGWFYKSVSDTLNERHRGAVFEELERTVATLLELAHGNNGSATKRPKDIDADPTPLTDLGRSVICGPVGVQEGVP